MSDSPRELARLEARAAKAAGPALDRALPPGVVAWIREGSARLPNPDRALALAGALAATSIALERAWMEAGSRVRDLLFMLHGFVRADEPRGEALRGTGLEDFAEWLAARLREDRRTGDGAWRPALFQWIDVCGERLTMRGYPRADHRARHARVLIEGPIRLALGRSPRDETALAPPADVLLGLHDLLHAPEQSAMGRNRLVSPDAMQGFGGFYGLVDEVTAPGPKEIRDAAARLARGADEAASRAGSAVPDPLDPFFLRMLREATEVARRIAETGAPSAPFAPPSREHRLRRASWLARTLGRR